MIPITQQVLMSAIHAAVRTHPQTKARAKMVGSYRVGGPRVFRDLGQGRNDDPDRDWSFLHPDPNELRQSPPWAAPSEEG